MHRALLLAGLFAVGVSHTMAAEKRPMTFDDLMQLKRIGDVQMSPDGRQIVYSQAEVVMGENRLKSQLWRLPTTGKATPHPLTTTDQRDGHPRWSPDGRFVLFSSNRSGSSQLWCIDVTGGEARQLTDIASGAHTALWSPDGKHIAFISTVYPEFSHLPFPESNAKNKEKDEAKEKNPVKAKVFTKLFFRHWDHYVEDKREHLFVMSFEPESNAAGEPRDVTPGDRDAYPTSSTFSVGDDYTFSPDGKYLVFTAVPTRDEAWSTNHDLCRVPITGGDIETLTRDNPAADAAPRFSPDGKRIAYRAQKKPGYESDQWELMVASCDRSGKITGKPKSVTGDLDTAVDDFTWGPDSNTLFFQAGLGGRGPIFTADAEGGAVETLYQGGVTTSMSLSKDGNTIAFGEMQLDHPTVVAWMKTTGGKPNTYDPNAKLLAQLDLPKPESVHVSIEGGEMQMWLIKPPGFDDSKKWPLVYLVHGGPQGAWSDAWSYRWNPELWAAQGYVVACPNPRGSTGFGQEFTDQIAGDWGGKCYDDLMAGVDYLEKLPYVDKSRMAAAGASFGGYMMNWFAVQTGKFKTLITHCGVWNFESMYATTEELWFDEWEHQGPPWGPNRQSYEKHSPHRFAANLEKFKTPMLIIHNDLDFRVPISEGLQLFTSLQRLGVPSKMINFPDEGHWVLKPKNSEYWHAQVFSWLKDHVPPGGK